MLTGPPPLPFSNDNVYSGLAKLDGILSVNEKMLKLEFQTLDAMFGVVKTKPKEVKIPLLEITGFRYKRNLFISRIEFRVTKLHLIKDFPISQQGEVKLKIKRKFKEDARRFESYIGYRISELRLEAMEEDTDL